MNLTPQAPALNYRLGIIDRIAQLGTNKATGEVEKVRTTTDQVWSVADLTPQGPIVAPLSPADINDLLRLLRECAFSEGSTTTDGLDGLSLMGCLAQGQKRQLWGALKPSEREALTKLKTMEGEVA